MPHWLLGTLIDGAVLVTPTMTEVPYDGAIATLEAAAELGLSVPRGLSVGGVDNIPESALADPPLAIKVTSMESASCPIWRIGWWTAVTK
jgi:hypothetical protein